MFFWNRNKKQFTDHPALRVSPRPSSSGRRFSVEIKLLAAQARDAGLGPKEVADLVGASPYTVSKWHKLYREGGPEALVAQSSSPGTQKIRRELERRIEQYRRENPAAGVRRIRDSLRREEGLSVSAETVRRVVNDAGLGNVRRHQSHAVPSRDGLNGKCRKRCGRSIFLPLSSNGCTGSTWSASSMTTRAT